MDARVKPAHDGLRDFLRRSAGQPFVWGARDCCLWATDWIVARRAIDPARDLRGTYATALQCARVLKRHGGSVESIARKFFGPAGLVETDAPAIGDVVCAAVGRREVLGLKVARGIACKAPLGIVVLPAPVITAWAI